MSLADMEARQGSARLELVADTHNILGEAPMWNPAERALYWVDALAPAIHRWSAADDRVERWQMPELTASLAFRRQGGIVAAMKSGFKLVNLATGGIDHLTDPEPDHPDNWLNDGKCDRLGRYWCGSVDRNLSHPSGSLYRLDADHRAHRMDTGFIVGNGIAWSPDDSIMYFADSRANRVYQYDFDLGAGTIHDRRVFVSTEDMPARVDGATVDSDGNYWCAHIADWHIACYAADGRLVRRVKVPFRYPTMCSFGGDNLDILFVTSSSQLLGPQERREQPLAGSLLAITDLGARGIAEPFYAG